MVARSKNSSTDSSRVSLGIDMSMRILRLAENTCKEDWEPTNDDLIRATEIIKISLRLGGRLRTPRPHQMQYGS